MNSTLILNGSSMKFAAGHFTIFSEYSRERLHGHNFTVECIIKANHAGNDLAFDYSLFKGEIAKRCLYLDEHLLLPGLSKWLKMTKRNQTVICRFGKEKMMFPEKDVRILPVSNITIEVLAMWFLGSLENETALFDIPSVCSVDMRVASSSSQKGCVTWQKNGS